MKISHQLGNGLLFKIFIISFFLLIFQTLEAMKPGPNLLVTCPQCKAEKSLMTIVSGNSLGALLWSDSYQYAPMAPSLSPVQKCLDCRSYFMLSEAPYRYSENQSDYSLDTGFLPYKEIKAALLELVKTDLSKEEEIQLRLEYLHRFNDAFRDSEKVNLPPQLIMDKEREEEDFGLHHINLERLISLIEGQPHHNLLLAELYRENGDFDKAVSELKDFEPFGEKEILMKYFILNNAENACSDLILIETD